MSISSSIRLAVDHLADLALWEAELAADPVTAASLLADRLAQVPDPRARRGRRHPLVVILVLTACAMLVTGVNGLFDLPVDGRQLSPLAATELSPMAAR